MPSTNEATALALETPVLAANQGGCANPFYPISAGRFWEYLYTTEDETDIIRHTIKDASTQSFTQVIANGDFTTEVRWTCGPDGIFSSENARMFFRSIPDIDFETLEVSGVTIPPADQWRVGHTWETFSKVRLNISTDQGPAEWEGEYTVINNITAIEPVSVPAGNFPNAYRVDAQAKIQMRIMDMENEFTVPFTTWFVEGVGIVKTASGAAEMPYTMELSAYGAP